MAKATTVTFGGLKVLLGDGADPEVFSAPCGFTSKSLARTKNLNETEVPDCDDPDAAADIERDVTSRSASISGSGVLAQESVAMWQDFYESDAPKNCKIEIPAGGQTITITQAFHLSNFEVTGERGGRAQVSVQMDSTGAATVVTA